MPYGFSVYKDFSRELSGDVSQEFFIEPSNDFSNYFSNEFFKQLSKDL